MNNNRNNAAKRTAAQVKSLLKKNGLECKVENLGDGRTFCLHTENNRAARIAVMQADFILVSGLSDKYVTIKCF